MVEVRLRGGCVGVGVGEGVGVGARLKADNGEADGGVMEALGRGLEGCGGEEATREDGGEEVKEDFDEKG